MSKYKLSDVGTSSILIGSLSRANEQCPSLGRWVSIQSVCEVVTVGKISTANQMVPGSFPGQVEG